MLVWRWPALLRECLGSLAAPLALAVELALPSVPASYLLTLPLLAFSATLLAWQSITPVADDDNSNETEGFPHV